MVEWWGWWRLCSGLYNLCPARADTGDTAGLSWERSLELSKFDIDIGGPCSQYFDTAYTGASRSVNNQTTVSGSFVDKYPISSRK